MVPTDSEVRPEVKSGFRPEDQKEVQPQEESIRNFLTAMSTVTRSELVMTVRKLFWFDLRERERERE